MSTCFRMPFEPTAPPISDDPAFALLYADPDARMGTLAGLLASMEETGVTHSFVMGFPWKKTERARRHNEVLTAIQQDHPDRISAFACADLEDPGGPAEIERAAFEGRTRHRRACRPTVAISTPTSSIVSIP